MFRPILSAAFLVGTASLAEAHATFEQTEAAVGGTTKITLRVPHGCEGEATNIVRIDLPAGVYEAKPMPKAGWTLTTVTGPYPTPQTDDGVAATEGPQQIVWSGGDLPDAWYDEFTFRATIGADLEPGPMLRFPVLQTCATKTADWTDTSGDHDLPNPAPGLMLTAAKAGGGHGGHAGMEHAGMADHGDHADAAGQQAPDGSVYTLGDLTLRAPFSRATLPNAPVGGGFLTVTNAGPEDDRLVSATSDAAGETQVHDMKMDGDVMKMRELPDGLAIPAGQSVELTPGGIHLMLMDLRHPLKEGGTVTVTLTFEKAGSIDVPFAILAPNARVAAPAPK